MGSNLWQIKAYIVNDSSRPFLWLGCTDDAHLWFICTLVLAECSLSHSLRYHSSLLTVFSKDRVWFFLLLFFLLLFCVLPPASCWPHACVPAACWRVCPPLWICTDLL